MTETSEDGTVEIEGVRYLICVPAMNPDTGEWMCGICAASGTEDCDMERHRV